MLCFPD